MNDFRRLITILIIIITAYAVFYYQNDISTFLKNPLGTLNYLSEEVEDGSLVTSQNNNENVKMVVVEEEDQVIKVVDQSTKAVVSVVRKETYFDPYQGPQTSEDSIGTGFIIDGKKGTVLTNKHVVDDDGATYSVVLGEGDETYDVVKVYKDPVNDFAILQINNGDKELPQLSLGDSDKLKAGQTVVAIGNALGQFGNSVTKGVVSGVGRGIVASAGPFGQDESIENVIQTDAALNPGNSGGPLLNLAGQVIGINVAVTQGAENIGFSLPINTLKPIIDGFNTAGRIIRPYLGVDIRPITQDMVERGAPTVGAFVVDVVKGSPAEKAGIQSTDIITHVNGVRIDNEQNTLQKIISGLKVDQNVQVVVERDGREVTLNATIGELDQ
jgi:serine protease Do